MSRAKKYPLHLKMAAKTISKWPKWKREIISNKPKKPKPARVWQLAMHDEFTLVERNGKTVCSCTDGYRLVKELNRLERKIRRLEGR